MTRWAYLAPVAFACVAMAQDPPAQQTPPPNPDAAAIQEQNREAAQHARELIHEMGLRKGMTVADLDTGIGYMLPFLSRNTGPDGRVIAEDSSNDLLAGARQLAENQNLQNIDFVKGTDSDPNLPEGKVDIVLALNIYHLLASPEKMLAGIYKSLKPDGKLVVVEHYKNAQPSAGGNAFAPTRLDMPDLIKELEANRFHVIEEKEHIKNIQYLLILEKK